MATPQEPHASTQAVLDEFDDPQHSTPQELREGIRAFRKVLHAASAQAAQYQRLVADACLDEEHVGICQKYNGLDQAAGATQNKHDRVAQFIVGLDRAAGAMQRELDSLKAEVARVREGRESVSG